MIQARLKTLIERVKTFDINAKLVAFWGRSWRWQLLAIFIFLFMFAINKDIVFAIVKLSSVFISKYIQWILLAAMGVRERFLFLPPFGISIIQRTEPKGRVRDELHMFNQGFIYLVSPVTLLMLTLTGFYLGGTTTGDIGKIGAYLFIINALATLMSIVPIFAYDGAMILNLIYRSSGNLGDKIITVGLTVIAFLVFIYISGKDILRFLFTAGDHLGWYAFILLFISSIWYKQGRDDDSVENRPGTYTNVQKLLHLGMYVTIIIVLMLVFDGALK